MIDKTAEALFAEARDKSPGAAIACYNGFQRDLKRIISRADKAPDFEETTLTPNDNGKISFMGRLLGETSYTTRGHDPFLIEMEVWETKAGTLIAAVSSKPTQRDDGFTVTRVCISEPADVDVMRRKIMDFLEWSTPARKLAGTLGWSFHSWID